jgi:hypothetical protein
METEYGMQMPPEDLIGILRRLTDEVESLVQVLASKPNEERRREMMPAWLVTREQLVDVTDAIVDEIARVLGVD